MKTRDFQLHLLSRMRGARVDAALVALAATRDAVAAAAAEAQRLALEETVHPTSLYSSILGPPVEEVPEERPPGDSFHGSRALHFHLPLWPDLAFVVREHPSGYAWGPGFQRRRGGHPPRLATALDLEPWSVVASEVTARFGTPTTSDAWSGWEDLIYEIPPAPGAAPAKMLLRFDLELLQDVQPWDAP